MAVHPLSNAPIVVVGAAGQVGTQLIQHIGLASAVGAGRLATAPAHLAGTPWLALDLEGLARHPSTANALFHVCEAPKAVICAAGATNVDRCETEPAWAMAVNADGPAALAAATPATSPFVYLSTEYVFDGGATGEASRGPYTEESPPHPISAYGRSKLRGEQLVLAARPDALILRTTVVYGKDPARKNFLYYLHRELSAGNTVRIVTDQISTPTSSDDLARATLLLLDRGATGIFHVCGPDLLSRYKFAVRAAQILDLDDRLIHPITTASLNQPAPRPLAAGLCTDKLRKTLADHPMKGIEDGIATWARQALFPA